MKKLLFIVCFLFGPSIIAIACLSGCSGDVAKGGVVETNTDVTISAAVNYAVIPDDAISTIESMSQPTRAEIMAEIDRRITRVQELSDELINLSRRQAYRIQFGRWPNSQEEADAWVASQSGGAK